MKFKILAGTDTFNKLSAIQKRIDESDQITKALVNELGAERWVAGGSGYVAGNLEGIFFLSKPEGWKETCVYVHHHCYFPKSTKQNKALLKRIAEIPTVKRSEVNDCVGFKTQFSGMKHLTGIGVTWGKDFHLVVIAEEAEYTPEPDMEEITVSVYNRLKLQLEEERREVTNA